MTRCLVEKSSQILKQYSQAFDKYVIGDPALSLLPNTVQNESYHLSIDENRFGETANGQSFRISKLYYYVNESCVKQILYSAF